MHEDPSTAARAMALGARGYVTKSNAPEVLVSAIAVVVAGNDNPVTVLSGREFEIFRLLASGNIVGEIATDVDLVLLALRREIV